MIVNVTYCCHMHYLIYDKTYEFLLLDAVMHRKYQRSWLFVACVGLVTSSKGRMLQYRVAVITIDACYNFSQPNYDAAVACHSIGNLV